MKSISEYIEICAKKWDNYFYESRLFAKKYDFVNRQKRAEYLLIILAGFQPYYWDTLLKRINECIARSSHAIDVCICIPRGIDDSAAILIEKAKQYEWSSLHLNEDLLSQAQNTAIRLHPNAKWIFKLDEDIVLPINYFDDMISAYQRAERTLFYKIGILAPMLNVNANGMIPFLRSLDKLHDFEDLFGPYSLKADIMEMPIHKSPELARWIWECSVPFNYVADTIRKRNEGRLFTVPVRFSIGAILFNRLFWESIGFFKVGMLGELGLEETQVNSYCMSQMFAIVMAEDVFAGHLGFFPQKKVCRDFFENCFVF